MQGKDPTPPAADLVENVILDQYNMAARFNREIVGIAPPHLPALLSKERMDFRLGHLDEEKAEIREAYEQGDLDGVVDGLTDRAYVSLGTLFEMGVSPRAAFEIVHRCNMKRVRGNKATRPGSVGFDAVKPVGWKEPDFSELLSMSADDVRFMSAVHEMAAGPKALGDKSHGVVFHVDGRSMVVMPTTALKDMEDRIAAAYGTKQPAVGDPVPFAKTLADPIEARTPQRGRREGETGFLKDDSTKPFRPELVPAFWTKALGRLFAYGAVKYAAENWRKGSSWQRYVGGAKRHFEDWQMGIDYDIVDAEGKPGTGEHNLLCAAWNILVLWSQQVLGIGTDDRPDKDTVLPKSKREGAVA